MYIKDKLGGNLATQVCSLHLMREKQNLMHCWKVMTFSRPLPCRARIKAACALTATSWA